MRQRQNIPERGRAGPSHPPVVPKKKQQGCCKKCGTYCYNREKKTFMNRTGLQCGALLAYFLLFNLSIMSFFIVFWYSISNEALDLDAGPALMIEHSKSPCPTIVPTVLSDFHEMSIWYLSHAEEKRYTDKIKKFFAVQEERCRVLKNRVCPFNRGELGPCGRGDYGYSLKKPCLYIKLNIVDKYMPRALGNGSDVDRNVPDELIKKIELTRETLFVNCKGESVYDNEHLRTIKYYPERAFSEAFFPIDKNAGLNPFVAVQLENITTGRVITLQCNLIGADVEKKVSMVKAFIFVGT